MAPTRIEFLRKLEKRAKESHSDSLRELFAPRTPKEQREMDERLKKIEEAKKKQ